MIVNPYKNPPLAALVGDCDEILVIFVVTLTTNCGNESSVFFIKNCNMISVAIGETSVERSSCTSIIHSEISFAFPFFDTSLIISLRTFFYILRFEDFLVAGNRHPEMFGIWTNRIFDFLEFIGSLYLLRFILKIYFLFHRTERWNFAFLKLNSSFFGSLIFFNPRNAAFLKLKILRTLDPWILEL